MKVKMHAHAAQRISERGATTAEVVNTVQTGSKVPAKFSRTLFSKRFPYNREWLGTVYKIKLVEAFAILETPPGGKPAEKTWLVVTVIVKFLQR